MEKVITIGSVKNIARELGGMVGILYPIAIAIKGIVGMRSYVPDSLVNQ